METAIWLAKVAFQFVTDEELLREVMNTVGKVGKLGEFICCVLSVSMLTEDATATEFYKHEYLS